MAKSHIVTSAKVALYINGERFGRVTSFTWHSSTPIKAIYGVDSSDAFELGVTTTKCTGSIGVLRMSGDGGAEGAGVTVPYEVLPSQKYFSITLIEHHRDLILFEARRCMLADQSWSLPAQGIMSGSFQFEGIEWSNEVRPASK
jgi:hypothetical protein